LKQTPHLLVVDDSTETLKMLRQSLSRHGFSIDSTTSSDEALSRAEPGRYDAAVVDLVMPGRDGAAVIAALRAKIPGLPVVLLTAFTHSPLITAAQRSGATVFTKPVPIQELVDFLRKEIG
jgi:DNA-binding response OmpR family regulator